jgi:hypothetical protein
MQPIAYDAKFVRGDDWRLTFRVGRYDDNGNKVYDVDFTGHTGLAQLRKTTEDTVVLLTFTVTIPDQAIAGNKGRFTISAPKAQTAALAVESGVYDVQLTSGGGETQTWARGKISLLRDVSRP